MREIIDGVAQIRLIQSFLFPSFDNAIPSLQQEYDRVSVSYDQLDGGPVAEAIGINDFRRKVGFLSKGNMLETAVGTGLQLPYYNWDKIERFTGVDLSEGMLRQANQKAQKIESFSSKINLVQGNVESLPFSDNQFDTIVDTFSMCVFEEPEKALSEMKRVVKSDHGKIILLENSRSTSPLLALYQDLSGTLVAKTAKGCNWDVDVPKLARKAGLKEVNYEDKVMGSLMLGVYEK